MIIGGGVMGTACAWILARSGASVIVLERSVPGAEASTAAAGIIGAHAEAHGPGPMTELMIASQARHPAWARLLYEITGIDVGYRQSGILRISSDAAAQRAARLAVKWQATKRSTVVALTVNQARKLEPALGRHAGGILFERDGRIDPPLFFRALHIAAQRAGARFHSGAYVRRVLSGGGRAVGVALDDGTELLAPAIVVAAGSWTSLVEGAYSGRPAVVPARGQIVELCAPAPVIQRVIFGAGCYLVPRDDGRTLVGSTLEFVGYRRDVTAGAVRDLLHAAIELVPELSTATLGRTWSNFRPYTADELPIIGETPTRRLFLATGHYRTGILLAPITAEAIAALIENKQPPVPLSAFGANRLPAARRRGA